MTLLRLLWDLPLHAYYKQQVSDQNPKDDQEKQHFDLHHIPARELPVPTSTPRKTARRAAEEDSPVLEDISMEAELGRRGDVSDSEDDDHFRAAGIAFTPFFRFPPNLDPRWDKAFKVPFIEVARATSRLPPSTSTVLLLYASFYAATVAPRSFSLDPSDRETGAIRSFASLSRLPSLHSMIHRSANHRMILLSNLVR
ncbi:hypothetical protein MUK42_13560 [Musa troglodytarum]|uniref:Uncharacterized protein n=1 Tax=Musa troglodytarum TaxID=320322 RepID=A0A9E7HYG9_9LILI|nr:hypothetical protein MUK42_13560 [Musa troglodytarum]